MGSLLLVPVGRPGRRLLVEIAGRLGTNLPLTVSLGSEIVDPHAAYDRERRQYHSTVLLERLADLKENDEDRVLGVCEGDLFVPILTFVFGEAQLEGPAAVFSPVRLRPSYYGLPDDGGLIAERCLKEALHEIGHTYGLTHCRKPACVMRASTSAGDVDLKPPRFCRRCAKALPSA